MAIGQYVSYSRDRLLYCFVFFHLRLSISVDMGKPPEG